MGASWILTRFSGKGGVLSKNIIIVFAIIGAIAFIAYFFEGIGKFCAAILPWDLSFKNQILTIILTIQTRPNCQNFIFTLLLPTVFR